MISGAVELQILVNEPRGLKAVFSFPSVSVFLSKVQIQKRLPTGTYTYRLICVPPAQSARYGVRIVEPILDVMEVRHLLIDEAADVARIEPAIQAAYQASHPVVMLIGRSPGP